MSYVTSVILTMSCSVDFDPSDDERDAREFGRMDAWFASKSLPTLELLTPHFAGGKHPQTITFGGGYNWFPLDDFVGFLDSVEWGEEPRAIAIFSTEDEEPVIWRPKET